MQNEKKKKTTPQIHTSYYHKPKYV